MLFSLVILVAVYRRWYEVPVVPGPAKCRKGFGVSVVVLPVRVESLGVLFRSPFRVQVPVVRVDVVIFHVFVWW